MRQGLGSNNVPVVVGPTVSLQRGPRENSAGILACSGAAPSGSRQFGFVHPSARRGAGMECLARQSDGGGQSRGGQTETRTLNSTRSTGTARSIPWWKSESDYCGCWWPSARAPKRPGAGQFGEIARRRLIVPPPGYGFGAPKTFRSMSVVRATGFCRICCSSAATILNSPSKALAVT